MTKRALSVTFAALAWLSACADRPGDASASPAGTAPAPTTPRAATTAPASALALAPASSSAGSSTASAGPASAAPSVASASGVELRALSQALSEKGAEFFSDNYISNETSYLQVAPALAERGRRGGAYVGVGPEQNFSYIALLEPEVAFIVDIRRDNLVEQLLYKAAFERAESRAEFVALLVGRDLDRATAPGPDASLESVLDAVERVKPDSQAFERIHGELLAHAEARWGEPLGAADRKTFKRTHKAFWKGGLELRFELKADNGRRYPTLRELVSAADPDGKRRGFLAEEATFRTVQRLEREDRIVPVVGDFAGGKALRAVGDEMRRRSLALNAFYVSNVEQYLFEGGAWPKWVGNVAALPRDADSLFIRCYLDQGKRVPLQMKGHRTATTLQKVGDFLARNEAHPYRSLWGVSSDETSFTSLSQVRPASSSVP
ncbi:MAG: hypothetical protein HY908_04660 [Myxococcales bacterium]|nr:hypothetical protein [Myxococcales bacterium]